MSHLFGGTVVGLGLRRGARGAVRRAGSVREGKRIGGDAGPRALRSGGNEPAFELGRHGLTAMLAPQVEGSEQKRERGERREIGPRAKGGDEAAEHHGADGSAQAIQTQQRPAGGDHLGGFELVVHVRYPERVDRERYDAESGGQGQEDELGQVAEHRQYRCTHPGDDAYPGDPISCKTVNLFKL